MFEKSKILITGGTGSFGKKFVKMTLDNFNPEAIIVYSRDEMKQWNMAQDYLNDARVKFIIGDVRDKERLSIAMETVDVVFHCAALKHVSLNEYNPFEVKKTNIDGVENIIECAIEKKVKKVIFTSSDKAVNSTNIMGISKMMGERLILSSNNRIGKNPTIFSSVRFGNVLDSSGSILQIFREQLSKNYPLTITDMKMTRFFINLNDAINLH